MSGTDFYYEQMPDLAKKLESFMPGGGSWRCFFGNSGTEAVEAAMKLARYKTGPMAVHRFPAIISRTNDGLVVIDRIEAGSAERIRSADSRRHAHPTRYRA